MNKTKVDEYLSFQKFFGTNEGKLVVSVKDKRKVEGKVKVNSNGEPVKDVNGNVEKYPDSYYAPKALYALSYIYLKDLFDTAQSKLYLEAIINDYSQSDIFLDAEKQIERIKDENSIEKQ